MSINVIFAPFKGLGKKQLPQMAKDFGSYSRRDEASISRYVSFVATKNTGQKTSQMG